MTTSKSHNKTKTMSTGIEFYKHLTDEQKRAWTEWFTDRWSVFVLMAVKQAGVLSPTDEIDEEDLEEYAFYFDYDAVFSGTNITDVRVRVFTPEFTARLQSIHEESGYLGDDEDEDVDYPEPETGDYTEFEMNVENPPAALVLYWAQCIVDMAMEESLSDVADTLKVLRF